MTSLWRTRTIDHSLVTPRPWLRVLFVAHYNRMKAFVIFCVLHHRTLPSHAD